MIQVSMREDYRIELSTRDLLLSPVLCALLFTTLEEAAINQDARIVGHDLICGSSYITRRAKEMNFHLALRILIRMASATRLLRVYRCRAGEHSDDRRSACS